MKRFEVLVEGGSDVPAIREILTRRFKLEESTHFRIHPHKGRGRLPENVLAQPDPKRQTLLDQLPAKLRGYSRYLGGDTCVLVVMDADGTPSQLLIDELEGMLKQLPSRPPCVLFRLAVEETESWFIADPDAVLSAFPRAKMQKLAGITPDSIVGAWEKLAEALGFPKNEVTGQDKFRWAEAIAPYLNLISPRSPSLMCLIEGICQEIEADDSNGHSDFE